MKRLFELSYEKEPYWAWDQFGLTACQSTNYGNSLDWFYPFRGGLNGFHSRMRAATLHYKRIHEWRPEPRWPWEFEYELATFFFHSDSAIECLVFALNALGYGTFTNEFIDMSNEKSLRQIGPNLLLDGLGNRHAARKLSGFDRRFPKTKALWRSRIDLLEQIFEQHDVSKHRHMIYQGGSMRSDAPDGFWNIIQVHEAERHHFLPMEEVILGNDLRKPLAKRRSQKVEEFVYLEDIAAEFFNFISETGHTILHDSFENIPIKHPETAECNRR